MDKYAKALFLSMRYIALLLVFIYSCNAQKSDLAGKMEKKEYWHFSEFGKDSIAGINVDTISTQLQPHSGKDKVIIALIDSDVDIRHEYLRNCIWLNKKETELNNRDDDDNGYIDDMHGWNFLAFENQKIIRYANNTSVRFIREFKNRYDELIKKSKNISHIDQEFIETYERAVQSREKEKEELLENEDYVDWYESSLASSDSLLATYNINKPYSLTVLDSLFNEVYTIGKDENLGRLIYFSLDNLKNNRINDYKNSIKYAKQAKRYELNENIDERPNIEVGKKTFSSDKYGSNKVNINIENEKHGTEMAGAIIKTFKMVNHKVANTNQGLELMIISIFPEIGAEYDDDLTKAIRYAVDNGADIINYSSTLNFLIHPDSVYKALKYAEKNNVLVVTTAGNSGYDLDQVMTHPREDYKGYKLSNLVMVGAIDSTLGPNMKPNWASYGKNTVDLFAPGTEFLTSTPKNAYEKTSGSSISGAIVSGVTASIKLNFPNLTAQEIKKIIMDSASKYEGEVNLDEEGETRKSFKELSKSGGVLNVAKALKMASQK